MNSTQTLPIGQIRQEDYSVISQKPYVKSDHAKYIEQFQRYQDMGTISSAYQDETWSCYNGVRRVSVVFSFDMSAYETHAFRVLQIKYEALVDYLKLFALSLFGNFVLFTISYQIHDVREFLTNYGNKDYRVTSECKAHIDSFLAFIGVGAKKAAEISSTLRSFQSDDGGQRDLAHLVNYMAIDNEISNLYQDPLLSDSEYIKWFPIFFWTKVTFIIPLRATEMIVTPLPCIVRQGGQCYLRLRRSILKGHNHAQLVQYNVDNDYRLYEYTVPDNQTVRVIEKYIELTKTHPRQFLFDFGTDQIEELLSLKGFNALLREFVDTFLMNNSRYDFTKYCAGIESFDYVTAGDSRPIAMANLFYQGVSADVCRQLAAHTRLSTSMHYYTNVDQTVLASAIIGFQRRINADQEELNAYREMYDSSPAPTGSESCTSPLQPKRTGDVRDCVHEKHLDECFGCRHYRPSRETINHEIANREAALDNATKELVRAIAKQRNLKADNIDELFLHAHTGISRYREACDILVNERYDEWQKHKNIVTPCY